MLNFWGLNQETGRQEMWHWGKLTVTLWLYILLKAPLSDVSLYCQSSVLSFAGKYHYFLPSVWNKWSHFSVIPAWGSFSNHLPPSLSYDACKEASRISLWSSACCQWTSYGVIKVGSCWERLSSRSTSLLLFPETKGLFLAEYYTYSTHSVYTQSRSIVSTDSFTQTYADSRETNVLKDAAWLLEKRKLTH